MQKKVQGISLFLKRERVQSTKKYSLRIDVNEKQRGDNEKETKDNVIDFEKKCRREKERNQQQEGENMFRERDQEKEREEEKSKRKDCKREQER